MMQDLYEKILTHISPLEIYGEFVSLKRSGKSYVGRCPFHTEDTPSFHVDPERGLFHCFGCGAGGNLITFIAQIQGTTRGEALRWLAQRAGIPLENLGDRRGTSRLIALLQSAAEFYHRALLERPSLIRYLESRGIHMPTLTAFQIGFAPPESNLIQRLTDQGFTHRDLVQSGLALERGGKLVERMVNRVVFPIRGASGKILAFGGRVVDKTASPKYINFETTPIFEKQRILYGYWEGWREMEDRGMAIVVEGYMDVLALHEAGIGGAVAPLGTYATPAQAALLKRLGVGVRLVFDGDEAGRRAARRSSEVFLREGVEVDVVLLPEGKDPADILVEYGAEELRQILSHPLPFWDFYLEGKRGVQAMSRALTFLQRIPRPMVHDVLIVQLATYSGVDPDTIRREVFKKREIRPSVPKTVTLRFLPYRVAALACLDQTGHFQKAFLETFQTIRPWVAKDPILDQLMQIMEAPSGEVSVSEEVETLLGKARFETIPEDEEERAALLDRARQIYLRRLYSENRDENLYKLLHRLMREDIDGSNSPQKETDPEEA